jgi:hypothetical protein
MEHNLDEGGIPCQICNKITNHLPIGKVSLSQ